MKSIIKGNAVFNSIYRDYLRLLAVYKEMDKIY